uniref:Ig-like domain-containing protein n=1 Tax=Biomphalaria glabrata TaxID=6526 RepID=A0A2C9M683_BIOGL
MPLVLLATFDQRLLHRLKHSFLSFPRQVSWNKVGGEHFLSIGTEVWVQDANLEVVHYTWPAGVGEWNLVFREVRAQDAGVYECQIISTEKIIWKVKLTVVDKPPHKPEIRIEGKSFVESGQSVYLRCNTTEGDRIPDDVDWFKDGDKIEAKEYPNVVITKFRSRDTMSLVSELVISPGTSNDSGTYICRSSSELIASVEVNVLVADSSNVKRGTGVSHTQTGSGYNAGSPLQNPKIYFTGNVLLVCLSVLVSMCINRLNT